MIQNPHLKKEWLIHQNSGQIEDYYHMESKIVICLDSLSLQLLGSGTYGQVVQVKQKETGQYRSVKIIPKCKVRNKQKFHNEIGIMKAMDHPNIIKLFETFEDSRNVYFVMELCEGGELFDKICQNGNFNEEEARRTFKQIVEAINYIHQHGVCHRDLKPENLLLLRDDENFQIKLADFGTSTFFMEAENGKENRINLKGKVGSVYYISPEVLEGEYNESCDIWSLGVILYILLSGKPPFDGISEAQIVDKIIEGDFSLQIPELIDVSNTAKDLIKRLLCPASMRLKAYEILEHYWLKQGEQLSDIKLQISQFRSFRGNQRLRKENDIQKIGALFKQLDKNGDGILTLKEISEVLKIEDLEKIGNIELLIKNVDADGTGTINYTEFITACMDEQIFLKKERLIQTFKLFDLDGSGKISMSELKQIFQVGESQDQENDAFWESLIKEADTNLDGEIDLNEFLELMMKPQN